MRILRSTASSCRHCGCYVPEGRRGGYCQQLSVPVQGEWKSCPLAVSPFAPSWEGLPEPEFWEAKVVPLPTSLLKEARPTHPQVAGFNETRYPSDDVA